MDSAEKDLLKQQAQERMVEIAAILRNVPSDLLLLFKTNDLLRSVNNDLNETENSFKIILRHCQSAINIQKVKEDNRVSTWLSAKRDSVILEWKFIAYKAYMWISSLFSAA